MGRRSITGGVQAAGLHRIRFDFNVDGVRYRPTLPWTPTEGNLRRARQHLTSIKARIAAVDSVWRPAIGALPMAGVR